MGKIDYELLHEAVDEQAYRNFFSVSGHSLVPDRASMPVRQRLESHLASFNKEETQEAADYLEERGSAIGSKKYVKSLAGLGVTGLLLAGVAFLYNSVPDFAQKQTVFSVLNMASLVGGLGASVFYATSAFTKLRDNVHVANQIRAYLPYEPKSEGFQ